MGNTAGLNWRHIGCSRLYPSQSANDLREDERPDTVARERCSQEQEGFHSSAEKENVTDYLKSKWISQTELNISHMMFDTCTLENFDFLI